MVTDRKARLIDDGHYMNKSRSDLMRQSCLTMELLCTRENGGSEGCQRCETKSSDGVGCERAGIQAIVNYVMSTDHAVLTKGDKQVNDSTHKFQRNRDKIR